MGWSPAHCAACHETFTTVNNFDRHRRNGHCADPAAVALVLTVGVRALDADGQIVKVWSQRCPRSVGWCLMSANMTGTARVATLPTTDRGRSL